MLDHLNCLNDIIRINMCLNYAQRGLLFDVLGVPLPLRDGNRRVPAADNGPALIALIEQEIARHEANLINTLNQRDRDDQQEAVRSPTTYIDKTRRQLRSDHARCFKRLTWAENVLARLQSGVPASTIIDPRTKRPINPDDRNPPTPKCPPAAAAPPTSASAVSGESSPGLSARAPGGAQARRSLADYPDRTRRRRGFGSSVQSDRAGGAHLPGPRAARPRSPRVRNRCNPCGHGDLSLRLAASSSRFANGYRGQDDTRGNCSVTIRMTDE